MVIYRSAKIEDTCPQLQDPEIHKIGDMPVEKKPGFHNIPDTSGKY